MSNLTLQIRLLIARGDAGVQPTSPVTAQEVFASMSTGIVRGPTRSAGIGSVSSRNERFAVREAIPCACARSVRFIKR